MNKQKVDELEKMLLEADEQNKTLRVQFVEMEVYDLTGFAVCRDFGEEYPHCTAVNVRPVNTSENKRNTFLGNEAMLFDLDDVVEIREPASNICLFRCS